MGLPRPVVSIKPGPSLLVRFGPAVVLLPVADGMLAVEADLRAAMAPWVDAPASATGDVIRALVKVFIKHRTTAPAWAAAVQTGADIRLLLHGTVRAVISGPQGDLELSGLSAATWVDELVTPPQGSIRMTLEDGWNAVPGDWTDLVTDRAMAGEVVLTAGSAVAEIVQLTAPETGRARPSVPVDDLPPPAARSRQRAVETKVVDNPVAALVADDDTRILLDRDYVFGRDPQLDGRVARGEASPIAVADPDNLISRVQVYVQVVAGVVLVRDNVSTNGTFIAEPGAQEWRRLGTVATELPPGWSLRMGRRLFTYREAGF